MSVQMRDSNCRTDGFLLPLYLARPIGAAARAPYPAMVIRPLLERYGFDGLSYVVSRGEGSATTGEIAWSTHPRSWSALYRREAYAAVDPRLTNTRHRVTPYLWDSADSAIDPFERHFVRDAARFEIRSGIAISLHDGASGHVTLTFDSSSSLTDARRDEMMAIVGDLTLIAMALHEGVLSWRVAKKTARRHAGPRLTQRECDCLKFAARGMTSADIGNKLSVTERTVNFHFSRLRRKLGALNRPEAIAKGVTMGFVTLD